MSEDSLVVQDSQECKKPEKEKYSKKQFNFQKYPKRRIAILFLYYGWEYDGLVSQKTSTNAVEDHLKNALLKTKLIEKWEDSKYCRSGRTDKDVSAFKQVASLIVRSTDSNGLYVFWPEDANKTEIKKYNTELNYTKILNAVLPKGIRILAWAPVPLNFNARFDCNERVYKYGLPASALDIQLMQNACDQLVGEHDFRNFCHIDNNPSRLQMSYIRNIHSAKIEIVSCDDNLTTNDVKQVSRYKFAELTIKASGFLWHQIRYIVSVLYEVGRRNENPEIVTDLLNIEKFPKRPTYCLAAATPLYLYDCCYNNTDISWKWDIYAVRVVRKILLNTYADFRTRCLMLKHMVEGIGNLLPELHDDYNGFNDFIVPLSSSLPASYVPLKRRRTCDSLEQRRQKLFKKNTSDFES
uniref:tRNA pseudouridine synthase n=1 Tax=Syphacia muris TaxID=451379 RepID=A0A0N5AME2_9BILA